jgi:hypothetical protein
MSVVNHEAAQPGSSAAGYWNALFVIAILLTGCIGKNGLHLNLPDGAAAADVIGMGGNGAVGGSMSGGSNGQGGNSVMSATTGGSAGTRTGGTSGSTGGTGISTGGVTTQGGRAGSVQDGGGNDGGTIASSDVPCNTASLWGALALRYRELTPFPASCSPNQDYGYLLVFDSEGHLINDTGYPSSDKQAWLDGFADQLWPCLAGQTIQYRCSIGD